MKIILLALLISASIADSYAEGVYDVQPKAIQHNTRNFSTNPAQRQAVIEARKAAREADVAEKRKQREQARQKKIRDRKALKDGIKSGMTREEIQAQRQRNMLIKRQLPAKEAKLLEVMNASQKAEYAQQKAAVWNLLSVEERSKFIDDYQAKINQQIIDLQDNWRL